MNTKRLTEYAAKYEMIQEVMINSEYDNSEKIRRINLIINL